MYKDISEITVESLQKHATMIHYFGLGFIQVKLGPIYRIHFYTNELPAIVGEEDIHNHRYDFTSSILFGEFQQDIFVVTDGLTHTLETESCKEGSPADTLSRQCAIQKIMTQNFSAGSSYTISHTVFHRVHADKAITLLQRGPITKEFAEVVRPNGAAKICPFSKKISETELWDFVKRMLDDAHL